MKLGRIGKACINLVSSVLAIASVWIPDRNPGGAVNVGQFLMWGGIVIPLMWNFLLPKDRRELVDGLWGSPCLFLALDVVLIAGLAWNGRLIVAAIAFIASSSEFATRKEGALRRANSRGVV